MEREGRVTMQHNNGNGNRATTKNGAFRLYPGREKGCWLGGFFFWLGILLLLLLLGCQSPEDYRGVESGGEEPKSRGGGGIEERRSL